MSLGLARNAVCLHPHSPDWALRFEAEKADLHARLQQDRLQIEHVGSTAVPGLMAKPILDILIGRPEARAPTDWVNRLKPVYVYCGDSMHAQDWLFVKGSENQRLVHLHVVPIHSPKWNAYLKFRDCLRNNAKTHKAYQSLKLALAEQYPTDRTTYTERKAQFIASIIQSPQS